LIGNIHAAIKSLKTDCSSKMRGLDLITQRDTFVVFGPDEDFTSESNCLGRFVKPVRGMDCARGLACSPGESAAYRIGVHEPEATIPVGLGAGNQR
jgi:hypothetical protein